MAEKAFSIELTESFLARLDAIGDFLDGAGAASVFDTLLADLRSKVLPNLSRFPRIGRRYPEQAPQSAEALAQLASLPGDALDALRLYLHGDYLILYLIDEAKRSLTLLSIRHHRQHQFGFARQ